MYLKILAYTIIVSPRRWPWCSPQNLGIHHCYMAKDTLLMEEMLWTSWAESGEMVLGDSGWPKVSTWAEEGGDQGELRGRRGRWESEREKDPSIVTGFGDDVMDGEVRRLGVALSLWPADKDGYSLTVTRPCIWPTTWVNLKVASSPQPPERNSVLLIPWFEPLRL